MWLYTPKAEEGKSEFEASVVYRARSKTGSDTQRNPDSKLFRA